MTQSQLRERLVKEALEWVNTPWKHNQSVKLIGTDCVGFVYGVARACGIECLDVPASYPRQPNGKLPQYLNEHLQVVRNAALPSDVLLMAIKDEPYHVALYIGDDQIVHAYAQVRRCVRQCIEPWRSRIRGIYRFKELVDVI